MGFLQDLAMAAMRKQVVKSLREHCPAGLQGALDKLLGDDSAVKALQNLVVSNIKTPSRITPEAVKSLPLPAPIKGLLEGDDALVSYLVDAAAKGVARLG